MTRTPDELPLWYDPSWPELHPPDLLDCVPGWAEAYESVCRLAYVDYSFRCNVWSATTNQYRQHLIREADRIMRGSR